jgi:hypothetical protein
MHHVDNGEQAWSPTLGASFGDVPPLQRGWTQALKGKMEIATPADTVLDQLTAVEVRKQPRFQALSTDGLGCAGSGEAAVHSQLAEGCDGLAENAFVRYNAKTGAGCRSLICPPSTRTGLPES